MNNNEQPALIALRRKHHGIVILFGHELFAAVRHLCLALTALGIAGQKASIPTNSSRLKARLLAMSPSTKVIGLLNLFIALWIMSIFGNYGDITRWYSVRQYELLHWSLLFGGAAFWFGLTFLFINLYTRFFEYFWESLHKAVFFAVLAVSFWYIGRRAEAH